jgi:hypothetical protein
VHSFTLGPFFYFSTLLCLPHLFCLFKSTRKPFLRLLATALVAGVSLRYRKETSAGTGLRPSWWQVHSIGCVKPANMDSNGSPGKRTLTVSLMNPSHCDDQIRVMLQGKCVRWTHHHYARWPCVTSKYTSTDPYGCGK